MKTESDDPLASLPLFLVFSWAALYLPDMSRHHPLTQTYSYTSLSPHITEHESLLQLSLRAGLVLHGCALSHKLHSHRCSTQDSHYLSHRPNDKRVMQARTGTDSPAQEFFTSSWAKPVEMVSSYSIVPASSDQPRWGTVVKNRRQRGVSLTGQKLLIRASKFCFPAPTSQKPHPSVSAGTSVFTPHHGTPRPIPASNTGRTYLYFIPARLQARLSMLCVRHCWMRWGSWGSCVDG